MLLGTLSLGLSIVVLNVHFSHENEIVPKWIEVFILTGLARILFVTTYRGQSIRREGAIYRKAPPEHSESDTEESGAELTENSTFTKHHGNQLEHPCKHSTQDNKIAMYQTKETALGVLCRKAKRYKCFSCLNTRKRGRKKVLEPYEWREVVRVLDRMFFIIVFILMAVSTFLTLYAPALFGEPHPLLKK